MFLLPSSQTQQNYRIGNLHLPRYPVIAAVSRATIKETLCIMHFFTDDDVDDDDNNNNNHNNNNGGGDVVDSGGGIYLFTIR
jgi:hypothetical protein